MDVVREAQKRLARARARRNDAADAEPFDWGALSAAHREQLAAERDLAALTGQEYATELTLDIEWDTGAPMPLLISGRARAAVVLYLKVQDPHWDGSYATVADPSSDAAEKLGIVEFAGVYEVKLGGLNDEALHGHPLWGKGLDAYAAHEVVNSAWIAESERRNSVHELHRGGWDQWLKHYVLCFHDETLECLAEQARTSRVTSSFGDAVRSVSARLLE